MTTTGAKVDTRRLVESAILIAIGTILSMLKIIDYPWGGGVTIFAMVPMVLLSYKYGVKWGFVCAAVFAMLQLALGIAGNAFAGLSIGALILMLFLDYIVAYMALGLGGIFRGKIKNAAIALTLGALVAIFCRYFAHMVSGVIFFGSYAEWFFEGTESGFSPTIGKFFLDNFNGMGLSVIYSVVLNGITMVGEMIITAVGTAVIGAVPVLKKQIAAIELDGGRRGNAPLK